MRCILSFYSCHWLYKNNVDIDKLYFLKNKIKSWDLSVPDGERLTLCLRFFMFLIILFTFVNFLRMKKLEVSKSWH